MADFNGDGLDDIATQTEDDSDAGSTPMLAVFTSDGAGAFHPPLKDLGVGGPSSPMLAGDFNGDGLPDLAMTFTGASIGGTLWRLRWPCLPTLEEASSG